ncbi:hypothetical protein C1645_736908 [Glomus cerebriforme]|uniref:Uncharacterized protein n=1 Tax=Glomus cerebriforme TaxID=658196 RepID=A0A397T690_9GLOM|nr:hypothetical protein C1645_736908 [Glomus cerebriforme]
MSTIAEEQTVLLQFISKLQDPAPQYVLGCLPAIATLGSAPDNGLMNKMIWICRCIGCPFSGLFYFCNIGGDNLEMCAFWLTSDCFIHVDGREIPYRPFGHHAMKLVFSPVLKKRINDCISEASVLDRLSSLASAYYILVGIFVGIARAAGLVGSSCTVKDWPYIPLALAWTLPAICVRVFNGRVVFKDPRQKFHYEEKEEEEKEKEKENKEENEKEESEIRIIEDDGEDEQESNKNRKILVKELKEDEINSATARTMLTAAFSVVIPWIAVILAYFTKPTGFACRSKFLSVVCAVWTVNSVSAYISHIRGETNVSGNRYIHGLLSSTQLWWVNLFGESCYSQCS